MLLLANQIAEFLSQLRFKKELMNLSASKIFSMLM